MTITNLISAWLLLPLVIADGIVAGVTSVVGCHLIDAMNTLVSSASVFAALLVAVDRFCAITDPFHYHKLINKLRSTCLIGTSWIITIAITIASTFGGTDFRSW